MAREDSGGYVADTVLVASAPIPAPTLKRSRTRTGLALRLAALVSLTLLGFGGAFYDVALDRRGIPSGVADS